MEDRRIRNTKKRIWDAMIQCLKSTSLDKITVKKICDTADINRSTFYVYYNDPMQLYEIMEKDFIDGLYKYMDNLESNKVTYQNYLKDLIHYIVLNKDEYIALVSTNSFSLKKVNLEYLEKQKHWDTNFPNVKRTYFEEFVITGIQSVLVKWLLDGQQESEDDISDLIYDFTSHFKY